MASAGLALIFILSHLLILGIALEDAAAWYETVHIAAERFISQAALEQTLEVLQVTTFGGWYSGGFQRVNADD